MQRVDTSDSIWSLPHNMCAFMCCDCRHGRKTQDPLGHQPGALVGSTWGRPAQLLFVVTWTIMGSWEKMGGRMCRYT